MKFMLDENVADRVRVLLEKSGFEVGFIRDIIPTGSPDPLVAFVSENKSAILVSHDGDFRKISPRIPDGQKTRFKNLSKIQLKCNEYQSADRIGKALDFIKSEFDLSQTHKDKRMQLTIASSYIRSDR